MVKRSGASPSASHALIAADGERSVSSSCTARLPSVSRNVSISSSARAAPAASTTSQPCAGSIHARVMRRRVSARARSSSSHALLELAHLPPPDREALLLFDHLGAIGRDLPDDRGRQQLLLDAERDQVLAVRGVHEALAGARVHPAAALHVEAAARLQRALCEFLFQLSRSNRPVGRQAIDDQILEPHGRRAKSAKYTDCAPPDQSLHSPRKFIRFAASHFARIFGAIAFNQNGIAEFVGAEAAGVERAIRAAQDALVGKRVQQLVVARARLVRAGQNRVDDAQPRVRADALVRDAVAGHDGAEARR